MLATIMRRGRTWPWTRMRPFLARFGESVWSGHLPSWVDFITTTAELRFLVHTGMLTGTACAHFLLGRHDEAASWAAMALQDRPDFQPGLRIAAASNGRTVGASMQ